MISKHPGPDYMQIKLIHDVTYWVETRLGSTRFGNGGEGVTIIDSMRRPHMFGEPERRDNRSSARVGDYILHNGFGQFRVLTKPQFEYWYEADNG